MANNDFDEVNKLADAWIRYHQCHFDAGDILMKQSIGNEHFWAIEVLIRAAKNNPELCWDVIKKIIERVDGDFFEASLAAGPLEDLLNENGEDFIERVEKQAVMDEKFRHLLGGVWRGSMPQDVWSKIEALREGSW